MDAIPGPTTSLTWANVSLGLGFVFFSASLSTAFHVGVVRMLLGATVHSTLQLSNTGSMLKQLLKLSNPWAIGGAALFLVCLSTCEAVINKSERRYDSMLLSVLVSLLGSTVPVWYIGSRFVIAVNPLWTSRQYFLVLSMLCWNALLSVVVVVDCVLKEVYDHRDKVEAYLAFGASRFEVCSPIAREALNLALNPIINQMNVIGIISIPDIMAGVIIGGSSVGQAAKLQIIVMFMVSTSTMLAAIFTTVIAFLIIIDGEHRVRLDRINVQRHLVLRGLKWASAQTADRFKHLCGYCYKRNKDRDASGRAE